MRFGTKKYFHRSRQKRYASTLAGVYERMHKLILIRELAALHELE